MHGESIVRAEIKESFQVIEYTLNLYPQSEQIAPLLAAVQDDVVGHLEALPHAQVVEERLLTGRVTHLHHGHV